MFNFEFGLMAIGSDLKLNRHLFKIYKTMSLRTSLPAAGRERVKQPRRISQRSIIPFVILNEVKDLFGAPDKQLQG